METLTPDEMEEVKNIQGYLDHGEAVLLVAKQSRIMPGGSLTTPNTIFATDKKLIVRNPMMLGLRESVQVIPYEEITAIDIEKGVFSCEIKISAPGLTVAISRFFSTSRHGVAGIPAIPRAKAERLVQIVRDGMKRAKAAKTMIQTGTPPPPPSPLEELKKLKECLDMGAITQEEYEQKKKTILEKL